MPEVVCNTSPLQYLHQIGQLSILPALVGSIVVPPAVLAELDAGIAKGLDLPQLEISNGSGFKHLLGLKLPP